MPADQASLPAITAASLRALRRIRGHIHRTPLLGALELGARYRCDLRFKAENFQRSGSFKVRGAFAKLTALAELGHHGPLITASSGNHGMAAAIAATTLGRRLRIVLPETVLPIKLERIRRLGAEIILHGRESGSAEAHAAALARSEGWTYLSPYNDLDVIAGQGTISLELLDDLPRIDTVFVAMGGGGLISGIGSVLKTISPSTRVIGCAAAHDAALHASIEAGQVVEVASLPTLADGVGGSIEPGAITVPIARAVIDRVVVCSEADIIGALRSLAIDEHQLVEGAAALALAGFIKMAGEIEGAVNVVVLCGANFDYAKVHQLIGEG